MNRDLLLVAVSMFTWGLGEGLYLYFQPIYLQQLGAAPLGIGALYGAMAAFSALAQAPAGYLADRWGRRPLMWASWIAGAIAAVIMAAARSLGVFAVGMFLYGLTGFVTAPLNSYITTARGRWSISAALALVSGMYFLGAVVGPYTGGRIGSAHGIATIYAVSAAIYTLSTLLILFVRPQPVEVHPDDSGPMRLTHNRRYLLFLGVVFLAMLATYLPQPLTPNYLQSQHGLSLEQVGQLGTFGNLGNALLILGIGQLHAPAGFLLAQAAVALYALLLWQGSGLGWLSLGLFFVGGYRAARATVVAMARPLVHGAQMGLAYGLIETANSVAVILAPLLAGAVYTHSPGGVYALSLGLILCSLAVSASFAFGRKSRNPEPVEDAVSPAAPD